MIKLLLHLLVILLSLVSVYMGFIVYVSNPVLGVVLIIVGGLTISIYIGVEVLSDLLEVLLD